MSTTPISIEMIKENLNSVFPLVKNEIQKIMSRPLSADTTRLEFMIRNDSFKYNIIWYGMDEDRTQTDGGERLLPDLKAKGIVVPEELVPAPGSDDYTAEIFCEEHHGEIVDLIAAELQNVWKSLKKPHSSLNAFVTVIDEDRLLNLDTGKWTDN